MSTVNPGSARPRSGAPLDPVELAARQKEHFGGMKFGCAFFGWLSATGMTVLLSALAAGVGAALGMGAVFGSGTPDAAELQRVGLAGGIALLVIVLIAYFAGGYVAARMARFSGLLQGLGVWLWALVVTIVLAVLGYVAGSNLNLLGRVPGVSQVPLGGAQISTTGGLVTAGALALISLVGALLGGLAGMRYHRRVDRTALEDL